jgi:hypothetical protein
LLLYERIENLKWNLRWQHNTPWDACCCNDLFLVFRF